MIKINDEIFDNKRFPDGTLLANLSKQHGCVDITWKYESDNEVFALMCITKHLKQYCEHIKLYLPYFPNARMDRVKKEEEVFTLKWFCDFINSLEFDSVTMLDVHSSKTIEMLNSFIINIEPTDIINNVIEDIKEDVVVYYPDKGSRDRYGEKVNKEHCYGEKIREWETGEILGLNIVTNNVDIKNKNILFIDDICSYGGTAYHSILKLRELGVNKIYLYFTHCENSILKGKLLDPNFNQIEKIYTTNSLITENHPMIHKIDVL